MNDNDMDAPVTRREFREGLAELRAEWKADLAEHSSRLQTAISEHIAHHFKLIQEYFSFQFRAVDDQYADLPGRVTRLEHAVFPAKPTRARRKS